MIETKIITYLISRNIPGIGSNVYAEAPVDPPAVYVIVHRSGGNKRNQLRANNLYTEVHAPSRADAAALAELVIAAMGDVTTVTNIFGCHLNTDYDATSTSAKDYRYQQLWQINYKE